MDVTFGKYLEVTHSPGSTSRPQQMLRMRDQPGASDSAYWLVRFSPDVVPSAGARLQKFDAIIASHHEGKSAKKLGVRGSQPRNISATSGWRTMSPPPSRIAVTFEMG
jgi:hypothetical protein